MLTGSIYQPCCGERREQKKASTSPQEALLDEQYEKTKCFEVFDLPVVGAKRQAEQYIAVYPFTLAIFSDTYDQLVKDGHEDLAAGRTEVAAEKYTAALKEQPSNVVALNCRAQVRMFYFARYKRYFHFQRHF